MTEIASEFVKAALVAEMDELHADLRKSVEPLTEEQLWSKPIEPGNSIGHLLLHLAGNLSHFVGGQLGKTGYVRDREKEFNDPNHPSKQVAMERLQEAVATFGRVVNGLSDDQLQADHPEPRLGNVYKALLHLTTHFALHRGQITYLIRLVQRQES